MRNGEKYFPGPRRSAILLAMTREMQLRLVYSLLRPAVKCAARFGVPVRTAVELMRLALYEVLSEQGLNTTQIAERLGQTPRHVRSLKQRLGEDFFAAEKSIGSLRKIEDWIASRPSTRNELETRFSDLEPQTVDVAVATLLEEGRIEADEDGRFHVGHRYVVLTSEKFNHRVDALNHHLDAVYQATLQRLVFDDKESSVIKTVSFTATTKAVAEFIKRTEGELRQRIAEIEERAQFNGETKRFLFGLTLAPSENEDGVDTR